MLIFVLLCAVCTESLDLLSAEEILALREEVRGMFYHAYNSYKRFGLPYDELKPLSCKGVNTFGNYSVTLIDALDMLAVLGDVREFEWAVTWVSENVSFDRNITVSLFETNIRVMGGLLSAHIQAMRLLSADRYLGTLLDLAIDLGQRMMPAFDTPTGIPYGSINLQGGVDVGESVHTSVAGGGSYLLEFGVLSALTGDAAYVDAARKAALALYRFRHPTTNLLGTHIDVRTGRWSEEWSGIGLNTDSYYEYLLKAGLHHNDEVLLDMFNDTYSTIERLLRRPEGYATMSMKSTQCSNGQFNIDNLQAFWFGMQTLVGDIKEASARAKHFHSIWRRWGGLPERFADSADPLHPEYLLRPELVESAYYLSRTSNSQFWLCAGRDYVTTLQELCLAPCGYAAIGDVRKRNRIDRMDSFFMSEMLKYLYLMFDRDNFVHDPLKPYVFSTEGHIFPFEYRFFHNHTVGKKQRKGQFNRRARMCPRVPREDPLSNNADAFYAIAPVFRRKNIKVKAKAKMKAAAQKTAHFPPRLAGIAHVLARAKGTLTSLLVAKALFGPALRTKGSGQKGRLAVASSLMCEDAVEHRGTPFAGKIVLVDRGGCMFARKVAGLEMLGAVGVIVVNNVDGNILQMAGDNIHKPNIPSVMTSQADGRLLRGIATKSDVVAELYT